MAFPMRLTFSLIRYVIESKLGEVDRFPLALMLQPTFCSNLACVRIREYQDIFDRILSVDECLAAVDEVGAPVVCLTGGEPLLHPDIEQIISGILERKRFLYLSTNGLVAEDFLSRLKPSSYFGFVFQLDGMAETHDRMAGHPGLFEKAILAIQAAKKAGFLVYTNTTVYKGVSLREIETLFVLLSRLKVDGLIVAPAFRCDAAESDVFLSREEIGDFFGPLYEKRSNYPFHISPIYLEFLAGRRRLECVPWGNPTRNPLGWKQNCCLITNGYCQSYHELVENTQWDHYGVGKDPRCATCMVHCGFEAGALNVATGSLSGMWSMVKWNFPGL
ncbi:MAG: adenosyl-hopene transferase HpnH [Dehalococcoidia bacterium]|nr:adenosyl-hopene transferase HpnH [Dehalococcoidia bacterium]